MVKGKNKRLFAGYYKKYDDSLIYVVTLVTDVDTGAESVIFHEGMYAENVTFKSMSRESFCEMVEVDGELVDKFIRQTNMKITEAHDTNIIEAGFNPPMRKPKKEDGDLEVFDGRRFRCSKDYVSYAKDLLAGEDKELFQNYVSAYIEYSTKVMLTALYQVSDLAQDLHTTHLLRIRKDEDYYEKQYKYSIQTCWRLQYS